MTVNRIMPVLTVAGLDTADPLYTAVLGLTPVMQHGWITTYADPTGLHQLSLMTRDAAAPVNPVVSIGVDDVDAAHAAAREAALQIVHPLQDEDWGVRRFFVRDRAGHVINVLSHH